MLSIYWNIANRNPYIMLKCEGYEARHGKTILRKWWYLFKTIYENSGHFIGTVLKKEKIYQLVDSHDIISFDIFDTLLVRPYKRPADLFFELEKSEESDGFGYKRIEAERKVRERYQEQEDVTLDQIYMEIGFHYSHMKEKEMELEKEVLSAYPPVYEIFQYALSKGKKIIICSDMYLPGKFLEDVLHINGYHCFDKLYISSDIMMTKSSGNLFKYVLRELNVNSTSILHFGDNLESDGQANMICGMAYVCVKDSQFIKIERTK